MTPLLMRTDRRMEYISIKEMRRGLKIMYRHFRGMCHTRSNTIKISELFSKFGNNVQIIQRETSRPRKPIISQESLL